MRRAALFLALLVAGFRLAGAGVVIVQEVDQLGPAGGKTEMTMTMSGERARIDIGREMSSIVDLPSEKITSLMHGAKVAMELPKGTLEALEKKTAAAQTKKPDLKPTGKKDTISGYACEEYAGTFQGLAVTYWVTKEVPDEKAILDQMSRLSGGADPFKGVLAGGGDFPGFPIRTTIKSPQLGTSTMTVVSIRNADVPENAFKVPADYKILAAPQLPAGPPAN